MVIVLYMVRIILYLPLPWYCREYVLIGFNDVLGPPNISYIAHIIPRIWAEKKEELISIWGNNRLIHLQYFTGRLTYACVYQRVYTCMHVLLRVLVCVPPRRVYCCMYVCVYHCVYRRVYSCV